MWRNVALGAVGAILAILFLGSQIVTAQPGFGNDRKSAACTTSSGTCATTTAINATIYTGWFEVAGFDCADFVFTMVDANDSTTGLDVKCWTSNSSSTTNGTGYPVCSYDLAAGNLAYTCPATIDLTAIAVTTVETWSISVCGLRHTYLNCSLLGTGVPAAADTVLTSPVELRR